MAVKTPAAAPDCVRAGVRLTLRPSDAPAGAAERPARSDAEPDPDPSLDLPFSLEPGMAVERRGSFFVSALRHEPRGSMALLALLGANEPSTLELGRLEGDVPPPRLALDGDDLLVGVEMPVSGGYQLRVARIAGGASGLAAAATLTWQDGPRTSRDESNAYDLAAAHGQVLFAWDDFPRRESHGRVSVFALSAAGGSQAVPLSGADVDAEEPRLAARPGGFWLAWLVDVASKSGRSRGYDPGESNAGAAGAVPSEASAYGARGIEVVALDGAGKPVGKVRRIRTGAARVVGYDLTSSPSGSAWLVWRQDAPSPGTAGGRVLLAEVTNEGPREPQLVREEDVGSGAPSWLIGVSYFLTFPDQRDHTLLLPVAYPGPPSAPLSLASDLQGAAALAAAAERVLFAQPRGRSLELFTAACRRQTP